MRDDKQNIFVFYLAIMAEYHFSPNKTTAKVEKEIEVLVFFRKYIKWINVQAKYPDFH